MKKFLIAWALLLIPSRVWAGFVIGPGDVAGHTVDGAFDLIAVDLTSPVTLAPGNYVASRFNYEFLSGGGADFVITGSITPFLAVAFSADFSDVRPIAVGKTITFTGPTSWASVSFGGADTFTVNTSLPVYGGLYWHTTELGVDRFSFDERMPVGHIEGVGSALIRQSGTDPPVIGIPISSPAVGIFQRTYDFAIEVDSVAPIPEPSTFLMAITGAALLGWRWVRRKAAAVLAKPAAALSSSYQIPSSSKKSWSSFFTS